MEESQKGILPGRVVRLDRDTTGLVLEIRLDADELDVTYPPEPGDPADVLPFSRHVEEEEA